MDSSCNQQYYSRPQRQPDNFDYADRFPSPVTSQQNAPMYTYPAQAPPSYSNVVSAGKRLLRPVVIPRIDIASPLKAQLPFMRAYSPDLRKHGVDERAFVDFIDNLAVAQAAPAPLQALDAAGQVVGIVPHHWAQAAGAGLSVVAGVGTAAVSRVRTQSLVEAINRDYFAPRGLKASICKSRDLAAKLGCGDILPALESTNGFDTGPSAGVTERRMRVLAPYIAPLSFNVPPPSEQRNIIDKLSAKQMQKKLQKREEEQRKKMSKIKQKERAEFTDDTSSSSSSGSEEEHKMDRKIRRVQLKSERKMTDAKPDEMAKIERKMDKEIRKIEKKQEKKQDERGNKSTKSERKAEKASRKQEKQADRMEFIIVENL